MITKNFEEFKQGILALASDAIIQRWAITQAELGQSGYMFTACDDDRARETQSNSLYKVARYRSFT